MAENKKSPPFFKFNPWVYFHTNEIGGAEIKLMLLLCYSMDFHNCVIMDNDRKTYLQEKLEIKDQQFNKLLKSLESKHLIFKKEFRIFISEQFAKKGR